MITFVHVRAWAWAWAWVIAVSASFLKSQPLIHLPPSCVGACTQPPQGLALGPQTLAPEGFHPVILSFGRQCDVRPLVGPPVFDEYHWEFIHAVPWTVFAPDEAEAMRNPGPYIFSPRLYLDDFSMVFLGWLYGLDKVLQSCTRKLVAGRCALWVLLGCRLGLPAATYVTFFFCFFFFDRCWRAAPAIWRPST